MVTGISGSGKSTMVLKNLVPALRTMISSAPLPSHVKSMDARCVRKINVIDIIPIGTNVRFIVATYSGVWITCAGCSPGL